MLIVLMHYVKPLSEIETLLVAHREYLDKGYEAGYLLASGPQEPRTGGVLLSPLNDKTLLENFLKNDPFIAHHYAEYQIIAFNPVKGTKAFFEAIQS